MAAPAGVRSGAPIVHSGRWVAVLSVPGILGGLAVLLLLRAFAGMAYLTVHYAREVDPFGTAVSYHAYAGRWTFAGSVLAVAAATVAVLTGLAYTGVRLGGPATARLLRRAAVGSLALAAVYLVARLPDLVPGFVVDGRSGSGLVQRVLFGLELAMLLVLSLRLLRTTRRPG